MRHPRHPGRSRPSHRRRSHRGLERNSGPMCATPHSQPESTSPCPNSIVLRTTSRDPSSGVRAARGGHSRPLQLRARIEGEKQLMTGALSSRQWPARPPGADRATPRRRARLLPACHGGVHIPSCSGPGWCHRIKKARVGTRRHGEPPDQIHHFGSSRFAIRLPCRDQDERIDDPMGRATSRRQPT